MAFTKCQEATPAMNAHPLCTIFRYYDWIHTYSPVCCVIIPAFLCSQFPLPFFLISSRLNMTCAQYDVLFFLSLLSSLLSYYFFLFCLGYVLNKCSMERSIQPHIPLAQPGYPLLPFSHFPPLKPSCFSAYIVVNQYLWFFLQPPSPPFSVSQHSNLISFPPSVDVLISTSFPAEMVYYCLLFFFCVPVFYFSFPFFETMLYIIYIIDR